MSDSTSADTGRGLGTDRKIEPSPYYMSKEDERRMRHSRSRSRERTIGAGVAIKSVVRRSRSRSPTPPRTHLNMTKPTVLTEASPLVRRRLTAQHPASPVTPRRDASRPTTPPTPLMEQVDMSDLDDGVGSGGGAEDENEEEVKDRNGDDVGRRRGTTKRMAVADGDGAVRGHDCDNGGNATLHEKPRQQQLQQQSSRNAIAAGQSIADGIITSGAVFAARRRQRYMRTAAGVVLLIVFGFLLGLCASRIADSFTLRRLGFGS